MVKVRQEQPLLFDEAVDLESWLVKIGDLRPEVNLSRLRDACELSEQAEEKAIASNSIWAEGHSSFRMGLEMAEILTELRVDEDGLDGHIQCGPGARRHAARFGRALSVPHIDR